MGRLPQRIAGLTTETFEGLYALGAERAAPPLARERIPADPEAIILTPGPIALNEGRPLLRQIFVAAHP